MNSLSRKGLVFVITLVASLITACSLPGSPKGTPKQMFVLQGEQPAWTAGAVSQPCLSLRVSRPESAPGFNTVRMAYRTEPNRLDYFAYHEWVAAPARMMGSMMEARLDASGMFGAVVAGSSDIRTDLRLDSELLELQQEFSGDASAVSFAVKVNLVDVPERLLIGSRSFRYRVPAEQPNAEAGVFAANKAAEQFLEDLAKFIAAGIHSMECPGRESGG